MTDYVDFVKIVLNKEGEVESRTEYYPYGEIWVQEGKKSHLPKYNSQELDKETGYYFYNARHYDPEIARFVTADTVIPYESNTQSWNRLSYVRNNPIRYKDPTGHVDRDKEKMPALGIQCKKGQQEREILCQKFLLKI